LHVKMRSTELLAKMAAHKGSYFLESLIAPYSDKSNSNPVRVIFPGNPALELELPDGSILDDFKAASFVSEDTPPGDFHRVYRLTPDGQERGKLAARP
jgi:hypothetical protein